MVGNVYVMHCNIGNWFMFKIVWSLNEFVNWIEWMQLYGVWLCAWEWKMEFDLKGFRLSHLEYGLGYGEKLKWTSF